MTDKPLIADEETALHTIDPLDKPEPATPATTPDVGPKLVTFPLPPEIVSQVAQARAAAAATAAEWTGFANGLVRGFLVGQGLEPRESVGDIAMTGRYTVEVTE